MQTSPCGHRVVCRRCFVKTIQVKCGGSATIAASLCCLSSTHQSIDFWFWVMETSRISFELFNGQQQKLGGYSYSMTTNRVAQSASLYSMSSTGSSCLSGML
uniref:Uncharacterized protein n=1 Tax=Phlebotomus papatasi TaxID=29031 RepID=A0A1B0DRI3_PHLPP